MPTDFQIIFIAGPQGSGKGTQGKRLADKLGFLFWGMGGILREIKAQDLQFAAKLALVDRGTLLPDETIIEILKDRLSKLPRERGIIFDGVPRRVGQAQFLIPYLHERGYEKMATILLDLPREESVKRLARRAETEDRADDTPEAMVTRFEYYDETVPPLVEYLKQETKFIKVDGRPSPDEVEKTITSALGM